MKTHSDIEIPVFQNLGTNRWYYHFNHSGEIIQDIEGERINYKADTVIIEGTPTLEKVILALEKEGLVSDTLMEDFETNF